jgi:RNA polymerase sigma factor (sigma-70 family)
MSPRISIHLLATQPDQRLVALAREGHERAFEALVHRYRRPLLRYARRMRLSEARAEDVLQQAFMQSWIALSGGASVNDVRSWLYRIVHNVAVNAMRGPAGEAHGELTQAVQDRAGLAAVSNIERTLAMRDALTDVAALPRLQQQAIFLTAVDGQSHDEVAGALGISEGAVRGLLYRARSTLRSAAAALTPPPLLAWASAGAGAGAGGPTAERLAELSAGGGAAGIAGLIFKGAVVAVTAGALATGTSVLSLHPRTRPGGARTHAAQAASAAPATVAGSLAPASDAQIGPGLQGAARHGRSGAARHSRHGSSHEADRHGGGSAEHRGESAGGADDALASGEDGGGSRPSGSSGGDGSRSDSTAGAGGRDSSGGEARSGAGTGSGAQGSSDGGSSGGGSSDGGSSGRDSGSSDASLADTSGPPPSPAPAPTTEQTSALAQPPAAGAESELVSSGDRQSGKAGGGD